MSSQLFTGEDGKAVCRIFSRDCLKRHRRLVPELCLLINSRDEIQKQLAAWSNFLVCRSLSCLLHFLIYGERTQRDIRQKKGARGMRVKVKFIAEIPLLLRHPHTHSSIDSFGGLVHSYLSNYSSFPRAPAKGLLANMLMKTNGGNLSVLQMSLGSTERKFEREMADGG